MAVSGWFLPHDIGNKITFSFGTSNMLNSKKSDEEPMFLTSEDAKDKVKDIILDDVDNDIVFVVAHKGIGKTNLLREIYGSLSFNNRLIVTDGKRIKIPAPAIKRCFAEGIIEYILRNNSFTIRRALCKYLKSCSSNFWIAKTIMYRKIDIKGIASHLCNFPLNKLKEIYYDIAGDMPLVIISASMSLTDEEIRYISELENDPLGSIGARITFIIGIRSIPRSIEVMNQICASKTTGIWVMPLLPKIENRSDISNPQSISAISVGRSGPIDSLQQLEKKVFSNSIYFETYEIVRQLSNDILKPYHLFILANQEVSLENYEYICNITKIIYNKNLPSYEKGLILPNEGKLLWLDVLSYYLALQMGIDEAVSNTQRFFLGIIKEMATPNNRISFGRPTRNAFLSFIKDASSIKENVLAEGFARYYSDFAVLARILFLKNSLNNQFYQDSLIAAEVLERVVIEFSEDNIDAVKKIYENTQICFVLDTGLHAICRFIKNLSQVDLKGGNTQKRIEDFLRVCILEAYKWSDLTIMEEVAEIGAVCKANNLTIRYQFDELTCNLDMSEKYNYFMQIVNKFGLEVGDLIMSQKTIFLSYAQKDSKIADGIDSELQRLGYDVKRDIRDVARWESLKDFMKSIRKEDYVVFLVSDTYLHRDNCLYEVMQFLKDESYEDRAYPIVINFSEDKKKQRQNAGLGTSMFEPEYIAEIVLFWQDRAKKLKDMVNQLSPENRAELDLKYREIANMAQTASEFLTRFFGDKLLMTINPEAPRYKSLALELNQKIQTQAGIH